MAHEMLESNTVEVHHNPQRSVPSPTHTSSLLRYNKYFTLSSVGTDPKFSQG